MSLRRLTLRFLIVTLVSLFFIHNSPAQTTNTTADQAPPIPGVGHNYVQFLNEIVNPATGSVSIRISAPTPPGRGISLHLLFPMIQIPNTTTPVPIRQITKDFFQAAGGAIFYLP
jgi:hypothetical protein